MDKSWGIAYWLAINLFDVVLLFSPNLETLVSVSTLVSSRHQKLSDQMIWFLVWPAVALLSLSCSLSFHPITADLLLLMDTPDNSPSSAFVTPTSGRHSRLCPQTNKQCSQLDTSRSPVDKSRSELCWSPKFLCEI